MDVPSTEFVRAGSLEELKAKGRLVLHGSHRPNKAANRSNAPLRRKEPPVSAGGFYLLDRSPNPRRHLVWCKEMSASGGKAAMMRTSPNVAV